MTRLAFLFHHYYQKGYKKGSTQYRCPTCNYPAQFVNQYNKWYCNTCRRYISFSADSTAPKATPVATPVDTKPEDVAWHRD